MIISLSLPVLFDTENALTMIAVIRRMDELVKFLNEQWFLHMCKVSRQLLLLSMFDHSDWVDLAMSHHMAGAR